MLKIFTTVRTAAAAIPAAEPAATATKAVTSPLATLTESVDNISKGNLDIKVNASGIKEFDGISIALERMRLGQQALVARMRRTTT